jgi:hypothetical protein
MPGYRFVACKSARSPRLGAPGVLVIVEGDPKRLARDPRPDRAALVRCLKYRDSWGISRTAFQITPIYNHNRSCPTQIPVWKEHS